MMRIVLSILLAVFRALGAAAVGALFNRFVKGKTDEQKIPDMVVSAKQEANQVFKRPDGAAADELRDEWSRD